MDYIRVIIPGIERKRTGAHVIVCLTTVCHSIPSIIIRNVPAKRFTDLSVRSTVRLKYRYW